MTNKKSRFVKLALNCFTMAMLASSANAQSPTTAYDGIYRGNASVAHTSKDGCYGGAITWRVTNGKFKIVTVPRGIRTETEIVVDSKGEFNARVGTGELSGSIADGKLTAKRIVFSCIYQYDLAKVK